MLVLIEGSKVVMLNCCQRRKAIQLMVYSGCEVVCDSWRAAVRLFGMVNKGLR